MIYKTISNKIGDLTDEGRVVIAVNAIGIEDADGDISMPGSFDKTLRNNFNRLKWFLNHNTNILLGVPISGKEEDGLIKMVAQFNMKKQISRDTYEDYKLYAEYGRSLEHSVGVKDIRRNPANKKEVEEWEMWEFSTLTNWGANPMTPLIDIKNMDLNSAEEHIKFLEKAISRKYSEGRLKKLENMVEVIRKAIVGEVIVKCSHCGHVYDYNSTPEEELKSEVADILTKYQEWIKQGIAYKEMCKLDESVRNEAMYILKSGKPINSVSHFSYCPLCFERVYKEDRIIRDSQQSKIDFKKLVSKL